MAWSADEPSHAWPGAGPSSTSFADPAGWVLLALVVAAYLVPQATAGEWAVKSRLVVAALGIMGGIAVLGAGGNRTVGWVWLAVAGWAALSVSWSLDATRSLAQAVAIAGGAAIVLFRWPAVPARVAALATLTLALVDALIALLQRAALPPGTGARVGGSFVSANHHAALVCAGAGVAAAWLVTARGRMKWWTAAAFAVLAGDVLTGGSRAGLVALVLVTAVLDRWRPRGFRWGGRLILLGVIGVAIASPTGAVHRLKVQLRGGEPGAFARGAIWDSAGLMLREVPLGGVGPGAFGEAWPKYRPGRFALFVTDYAHSDLLQWVVELGLVGLGLAIWAFACWWRLASRSSMADPGRFAAGTALAGLAVFVFVDFPLHVPALALLAVALAASLAAPARAAPVRLGVLAAAVGACVILWLASDAVADLTYFRGAAKVGAGDIAGASARFDRALLVQPSHALSLEGLAEVDPEDARTSARLAAARRLRPAWTAPIMTGFEHALAAGDSGAAGCCRDEALRLDPEGLDAGIMTVRLALHTGRRAFAARQVRDLAARWPGSFDVALLLADVAINGGQREEARRILDSLQKAFPGSAAVRDRLERLSR